MKRRTKRTYIRSIATYPMTMTAPMQAVLPQHLGAMENQVIQANAKLVFEQLVDRTVHQCLVLANNQAAWQRGKGFPSYPRQVTDAMRAQIGAFAWLVEERGYLLPGVQDRNTIRELFQRHMTTLVETSLLLAVEAKQ